MQDIDIEAEISTEGGLWIQKDAGWGDVSISTPTKVMPIRYLTANDTVDEAAREIAEVHTGINSSDLEAYRSGQITPAIQKLLDKLKHSQQEEVRVVFLEYGDAHEIDKQDMRTIVELQDEHADIITAPCQSVFTDALSPHIDDGRINFDTPPYRPYQNGVMNFLEVLEEKNIDKPGMGVLPPIGWSRRREVLRDYENYSGCDIQMFAIDFRGLKPTKQASNPTDSGPFDELKKLITDLAKRGELSQNILYAVNHRPYFPRRGADFHPSEAAALIGSGVDIIGATHIHRGVGGDGPQTNIKIFEPDNLGFQNVPVDDLKTTWPVNSSISPDRLTAVNNGKRNELRNLINAEGMYFAFKDFRRAIQNGNERQFMEAKNAYHGGIEDYVMEMKRSYEDAVRPDLPGVES